MNTLAAVGAGSAVIGPARANFAWAVAARVIKAVGLAVSVTVAALALAVQTATADPKSFTLSSPSSGPVVLTTQSKGLLSQAQKDNIANNLEPDKYKGAGYTLLHLRGRNGEELNQVTGLQDCAGYVFSKLWPNATLDPVHLTAANFYRDIIQAFKAPEVGFGGAQPNDVVVYFNVNGQAKHIAYVTAVSKLSVTIDTKDEDERIYSTTLYRNPIGWLTNNTDPLIRNYGEGGVKIFHVDPNIQVTENPPDRPSQPNVAAGNAQNNASGDNGNANNANAANNNQPNANNANAGGDNGNANQPNANAGGAGAVAGNQGAGNQGAGNQGAGGQYDPVTNTGGNQNADCKKAQDAVADAQAGLDTATEFINAAINNLHQIAQKDPEKFGDTVNLIVAEAALKTQLVPFQKKVDNAKAAAQKICNTPTQATTATAAPARPVAPAQPPLPPPAPIAVVAPPPPPPPTASTPAKPDCTQQGKACMAAQARYAEAAHMIFNVNDAYDRPLPCVAGYSASLQTPLSTPQQQQLLQQWANARDAYLACSRGVSNPTQPALAPKATASAASCVVQCTYSDGGQTTGPTIDPSKFVNSLCQSVWCKNATVGTPPTNYSYGPLVTNASGQCNPGFIQVTLVGAQCASLSSNTSSALSAPSDQVQACESKPPFLPWGGTGSATITVSGGKPCGIGWHDTPGGPGGVTVLDSMKVTSPPSHGSLKPQDQHVIIFTPAPGYKGQDSFTLSMQEHNGSRRATMTVKVSVTIQ